MQINGLYADLPVDVCFDLRLAGAFQKLSAYDISKLPHCILSQEAKVFVDQSGDAINEASGLLAGLLEGGLENADVGLFTGCSKLNVAAGEFPLNASYHLYKR